MVRASTLIILLSTLVCYAAQSRVVNQSNVKFELRLAEKMPADGLDEATIENSNEKIYLHKEAIVTSEDLIDARVASGLSNRYFEIHITFNSQGAEKMAKATRENIGKQIAVLINGKVVSAPVVRDAISEKAVISGAFTKEEAERIAAGIRAQHRER